MSTGPECGRSPAGGFGALAAVSLSMLDWSDRSFAVSRGAPDPALEESLARCGLLSPPWLLTMSEGEAYAVVDGFKRLEWLRGRGTERVECFVFPRTSDRNRLMLRRIEAKLFGPAPNIAEKAWIVARLAEILPGEALGPYLKALGIPARPEAVERWTRLASADESLLEAAALEEICDRAALEMVSWEEGDARAEAVAMLRELRCSASIQVELLERITEIALAGHGAADRAGVLRAPEVRAVLTHASWNRRAKTQALRDLFHSRRFPRLHAREERFRREVAAIRFPDSIHIIHPPAFEGEEWQLRVRFSDSEELRNMLEEALGIAGSPGFEALLLPHGADSSAPAEGHGVNGPGPNRRGLNRHSPDRRGSNRRDRETHGRNREGGGEKE